MLTRIANLSALILIALVPICSGQDTSSQNTSAPDAQKTASPDASPYDAAAHTQPMQLCSDPTVVAGAPCATPPKPKFRPSAQYTEEARQAHLEGQVVLSVVIGPDGTTQEVGVARSLGKGLDESALKAVQRWEFQPATYQGSPVAVRVYIPIVFKLAAPHTSPSSPEECTAALPELRRQVKANERDLRNNFELAGCALILNRDREAVDTLQAAVDVARSTDEAWSRMICNNAAWTLADHNVGLDSALRWATAAAISQTGEVLNSDSDHLKNSHIQQSRTLITYWDTLGWVYFVRGDFKNAEKFLAAGWPIWQDPYLGNHLAQTYEKLGRKDDAIRTLAMAVAAEDNLDDRDPKYYTVLTDLLAKWVPAESMSSVLAQGKEDLKKLQTITVSNTAKLSGDGDFLIAETSSKVTQARKVSGDDHLHIMTAPLQTTSVHLELPDGKDLVFARRGTMHCEAAAAMCDFVMMSPVEALKRASK
jgi:TonB family protein